MNNGEDRWKRLVQAARPAWSERERVAPPGFSERVVRQAFAAGASPNWIPAFAWRAIALATLVTALTVALNLRPMQNWVDDEAAELGNTWIELELQDLS